MEVYDTVLKYVGRHFKLEGKNIVRPFYPGGNYDLVEYGVNDVVIDNPPFSIISQIVRFYDKHNIQYFLFAPHLTLFSSENNATKIVCGASIVYENGARVKTSFLSNMFGDIAIMSSPELYTDLERLNKANAVNLPKYEYPANIIMVSMVQDFTSKGIPFSIHKDSVSFCRGLADQKRVGKAIFGSGFLISEKAAAEKAAAEKAAAEKAAAEKVNIIRWRLSDRELQIIKSLK
jgi:hypothetical protein